MSGWTRFATELSMLLVVVSLPACVIAEEQLPATPERGLTTPSGRSILTNGLHLDLSRFSKNFLSSRVEMPPQPRVTRSCRSLRSVALVGGDRFVGECIDFGMEFATFRLLGGQTIRVPVAAVAALTNPPGEVDLLEESFETGSSIEDSLSSKLLDDTQAADGRRSLRLNSTSSEYRKSFSPPLSSVRIEFSFRIAIDDPAEGCGEWSLEWDDSEVKQTPVVVRIEPERHLAVTGAPRGVDATSQRLILSEAWHTCIALITPQQSRLMIDESILASFPTPRSSIRSIRFQSSGTESKNVLRIDEFHVHSLSPADDQDRSKQDPGNNDVICLATGDELFGRLIGFDRTAASIETFGEKQSLSWSLLTGLSWRQSSKPVGQTTKPNLGVVSQIEMQPFVDRPDCKPERWTVTVLKNDSKMLVVQHSLVGELKLRWSDVRRVDSSFFGRTLLVDARRFHLGNSIRPDFHRHLPDGTELRIDFRLQEIPAGHAFFSLDVAELEASGPTAPPGSPFLTQLRAGQLITEAFVNDQRVGRLNSLIRFKANSETPDRIRFEIPREILKLGENSFQLRQQPLKYPGREFDDCEIGNIRLEFEH